MPVYDNPVQGLRFECDECEEELFLAWFGRTHEKLAARARESGWQVEGLTVVSAGSSTCMAAKILCPNCAREHSAKLTV